MSRFLRSTVYGGAVLSVACMSLVTPLMAQSGTPLDFVNNVFTRGVQGPGVRAQSTTGPVVVGPLNVGGLPYVLEQVSTLGRFTSTNGGTAAALQSTLRASASLSAYQPVGQTTDNRDVQSRSDFTKRVLVQANPGSRLNAGDAVNLALNLRFDGQIQLGFPPVPAGAYLALSNWSGLLTSADIFMRYRVNDLTNLVSSGEDEGPTQIGDVSYSSRIVVDQARDNQRTRWSEDIRENWSGSTNGSGSSQGPITRTYEQGIRDTPYAFARNIDLGVLSFVIQTTVGAELEITGSLDVFLQATGLGITAFASGDFSNTFDADLFSTTGDVTVLGEERGVYGRQDLPTTVPEPTSWCLMASGLVGLAMISRRRGTRQGGSGRTE